ncbi:hypothetical protein WDZ92_32340, partial [Nostoc sp. NIES-2111]
FEFPACDVCNGGTSDDDLIAAFLSYLSPDANGEQLKKGQGLLYRVGQQRRQLLRDMFQLSVTERRQKAREVGWTPAAGQTYDDFPGVKLPREVHEAIRAFAGKLTKSLYWKETGKLFPADGGILFHWFTNANLMRDGRIAALEGFIPFLPEDVVLRRNGKDLSHQLGMRVKVDDRTGLMVVMATFRQSFGFVTLGFVEPGAAARVLTSVKAETGRQSGPFELI